MLYKIISILKLKIQKNNNKKTSKSKKWKCFDFYSNGVYK